jgi:hypothetical protein
VVFGGIVFFLTKLIWNFGGFGLCGFIGKYYAIFSPDSVRKSKSNYAKTSQNPTSNMDKKPIGYKAGETYFMDKKSRPNPKYSGITGKLSTGLTTERVQIVTNQQVTKRRGETFNRITKSSLAKLLAIEHYSESIYDLDQNTQIDLTS